MPAPIPTLHVDEQHDEEGDLVFTLSIRTHDRRVIEAIEQAFPIRVTWRTENYDYERSE